MYLYEHMIDENNFITNHYKLWDDIYACAKQYRCSLAVYPTTLVATPKNKIVYRVNRASGRGINILDRLNNSFESVLSYEMIKLYNKLNKIVEVVGVINSFSDTGNVNFAHHYQHIISNIDYINGCKGLKFK